MTDISKIMSLAASGMQAQSARLRISTENVANADTPGYQRKVVPFEQVYDRDADIRRVATGRLDLDRSEPKKIYNPGHPMADGEGYYFGSNVNSLIEIADSREAMRSYQANLKMFDQAKQMASSLLDLLRR